MSPVGTRDIARCAISVADAALRMSRGGHLLLRETLLTRCGKTSNDAAASSEAQKSGMRHREFRWANPYLKLISRVLARTR
jgi:hypothetical protein